MHVSLHLSFYSLLLSEEGYRRCIGASPTGVTTVHVQSPNLEVATVGKKTAQDESPPNCKYKPDHDPMLQGGYTSYPDTVTVHTPYPLETGEAMPPKYIYPSRRHPTSFLPSTSWWPWNTASFMLPNCRYTYTAHRIPHNNYVCYQFQVISLCYELIA